MITPPPFTPLACRQGLGKTVQVIAMICHLVETQGGAPFLIAAPASVLPNWAAELARWAPALKVVQYKGSAEEREEIYYRKVRERGRGGARLLERSTGAGAGRAGVAHRLRLRSGVCAPVHAPSPLGRLRPPPHPA